MSVTLKEYGTSNTITLNFKSIDISTESENENIAIPDEAHQFIFLGDKGDTIEAIGDVFSESDHDLIKTWNGQILLTVDSSTYPEMDAGTYWAVVGRKLSRKGGYLDRWTYTLKLIQCYSGSTVLADGSDL